MKNVLRSIAAAALAAAVLGGCASMPSATGNEALLAHMGQVLRAESAPGSVVMQPVAGEVRIGQPVGLDVLPRRSGYLYVYHVGSDGGSLSMLFPNATDAANFVSGPTRLPRATWRLTARGPQGVGHFLAVLTEQPQDLLQQSEAVRQGQIRIAGPYAASLAQIRELP